MKKVVVWIGISAAAFASAETKSTKKDASLEIKRIGNVEELRKTYGLTAYGGVDLHNVKVAVLDRGFTTVTKSIEGEQDLQIIDGQLPPTAVIVERYNEIFGDQECPVRRLEDMEHGGVMAQTVWAMTGNNPLGPQFYLLNANGRKNFGCAIRYAREIAKVDIILFSQNFEYGGKFNGGGFLNALVDEATASGILWINAAGNYGNRVYNGPIPEKTTSLTLVSNASPNKVTITVTWPGSDSENVGTENDLDFEVFDKATGEKKPVTNVRQVRTLTKDLSDPPPPTPGDVFGAKKPVDSRTEDTNPFEQSTVVLGMTDDNKPKEYEIRIIRRGGSFNRTDKVRVTVMPIGDTSDTVIVDGKEVSRIEFKEAKDEKSIMIPGDNPNVVTVGDTNSYSAKGPTLDGRTKPEIVMKDSHVDLVTELAEGGTSTTPQGGTSHAGAMFAGWAAIGNGIRQKYNLPNLKREDVIRFVQSGKTASTTRNNLVEGSIPPGARVVSLQTVRDNYTLGGGLVDAVDQLTTDTAFMPFVAEDGSFILGVAKHPSTMTKLFPTFSAQEGTLDQWQFYVSLRAPNAEEATVSKAPIPFFVCAPTKPALEGGYRISRHLQPWEAWAGYSKSDFIEIRQVQFTTEKVAGTTVNNLFKAPSEKEIKAIR